MTRNGPLEHVSAAIDGDLAVAHRFEQSALGAGSRAIDLVSQNHVGEDRTRLENEFAGARVVDAGADNIGRQQVGRELHAMKRAIDAGGERSGEQGLADARDVLNQDVTFSQKSDNR